MRASSPFRADDLEALDDLYSRADAVVAMEDVLDHGRATDRTIGLRHDVDDNAGSFEAALDMAAWEGARGYRSTYFLLHTAGYWGSDIFAAGVEWLLTWRHEVGLHVNAIPEALRTGRDPFEIAREALAELRELAPVRGVVAHGDAACRIGGRLRFVNDEIFTDSPRPEVGPPDRVIEGTQLRLRPRPRADLGLDYDPNWLPRADYLSDSGGRWSQSFEHVAARFPMAGRLHMLVHPDWWTQAFPGGTP